MKVYEYTKHNLSIPHPAAADEVSGAGIRQGEEDTDETPLAAHAAAAASFISRHDIFSDGSAFVLKHFLTSEECRDYIRQAKEIGFSDCAGYSSHRIRKTDRIAAHSDEVAQLLFHRLEPFLGSPPAPTAAGGEQQPSKNSSGISNGELLPPPRIPPPPGTIDLSRKFDTRRYPRGIPRNVRPYQWRPVGVNPTFRICRYQPGGFFFPHYDGGFRQDEYRMSLKTFMVYLNDDFDGGETRFFKDDLQRHYAAPVLEHIVHTYKPCAGDVLIFNSEITHDGAELKSGQKYILRSEIMYKAFFCGEAAPEAKGNNSGGYLGPEESRGAETPQQPKLEPDHDPDAELTWP